MSFLRFLFHETAWYGLWWILFIGIAFFAARYLGWPGVFGGGFVIFVCVVYIDLHWVFEEMRLHPENERDADGAFMVFVLLRAGFINLLLLSINFIAMKIRARTRARKTYQVSWS